MKGRNKGRKKIGNEVGKKGRGEESKEEGKKEKERKERMEKRKKEKGKKERRSAKGRGTAVPSRSGAEQRAAPALCPRQVAAERGRGPGGAGGVRAALHQGDPRGRAKRLKNEVF